MLCEHKDHIKLSDHKGRDVLAEVTLLILAVLILSSFL